MNSRILLVEDEPGLVLTLTDLLRAEGYEVASAMNGTRGCWLATQGGFDLLILDVMLPGLGGFAICHAAREHGFDGGILMLTARSRVEDRVEGLSTGADDYLVKPFDSEELLARVKALLRRVHKEELTPVMRFQFGDISLDFAASRVLRAGEPVNLAAKELQLLRCLVDHRGQVLTRERILAQVWKEQPFITVRTVNVHVAWLRQKLEDDPQAPKHILTVRGEGYRFRK